MSPSSRAGRRRETDHHRSTSPTSLVSARKRAREAAKLAASLSSSPVPTPRTPRSWAPPKTTAPIYPTQPIIWDEDWSRSPSPSPEPKYAARFTNLTNATTRFARLQNRRVSELANVGGQHETSKSVADGIPRVSERRAKREAESQLAANLDGYNALFRPLSTPNSASSTRSALFGAKGFSTRKAPFPSSSSEQLVHEPIKKGKQAGERRHSHLDVEKAYPKQDIHSSFSTKNIFVDLSKWNGKGSYYRELENADHVLPFSDMVERGFMDCGEDENDSGMVGGSSSSPRTPSVSEEGSSESEGSPVMSQERSSPIKTRKRKLEVEEDSDDEMEVEEEVFEGLRKRGRTLN